MEESFSTRPVVGRWIALDFRPTRPLTLLGPSVAALCGAIASGGLGLRGQAVLLFILSLLLCDALLGAWRALWFGSELRAALNRASLTTQAWRSYDDEPRSRWARLRFQVSRRIEFLRRVIWPLIDSEIIGMFFAGVLGLSIAAVLGQVALVEGAVGTTRGAPWRAIVEVVIPWLIAQSAFGYFSLLSLAFALIFTLIYRALLGIAIGQGQWIVWNNLLHVSIIVILLASGASVGAGIVALGWIAQLLWQSRFRLDRDGKGYARHVQSYLLVAMLVSSLSLWL